MSLRSKIILILSAVVGLYAVADNGMLRFMAMRSFEDWEEVESEQTMHQAEELIEDEIDSIKEKTLLWATLEETNQFIQGRSPRFVETNLGPRALRNTGVDLLYICDEEGRVLWGRIEAADSDDPIRLRAFPSGSLGPGHDLRALLPDQEYVSGLMMTEHGPMFVCSHRVGVEGQMDSSAMPLVVLGRFFDGDLRRTISERTTVDIEIVDLEDYEFVDDSMRDQVTASTGVVSRIAGDDALHLFKTLQDVRRRPSMLLMARLQREIAARGRKAVNYALLSTLATAALILLVLLRLLQAIVVRPLSALTEHAVLVGKTDDTSLRAKVDRKDEIGVLSKEFDSMLEKLERSREQVVHTARRAGMSEIATGVLHNVGNVLNSVNVSANLVTQRTCELPIQDLDKMIGVLQQHEHDLGEFVSNDPQGKHTLPFLTALVEALKGARSGIEQELTNLTEGIEHMADLVRSQQTYAGTKGVFERASLADQVEAAIRMCNQAYGANDAIRIEREFEDIPSVPIDKNKLMEVLVNLIHNAHQALMEVDQEDRTIVLRIRTIEGERVSIEVEDNGPGISEENLTLIFQHGFTTKAEGHGFGLHVSANAATEMGATLSAASDGPGKGARFVVDIPTGALEPALAA